jgi:putative hydrolase of the HAD superfamily
MPQNESKGEGGTTAGQAGNLPTCADPFDPKSYQSPDIIGSGASPTSLTQGVVSGTPAGPAVKLIAFDMGHVFVDFDWDEVCKGFMARANGLTRDDMRQIMAYLGNLGYERGTIGTVDFLRELNQKLGITLTLDEFRQVWNSTFHENPEMAKLLQSLKEKLPLYLLSNTNEEHYSFLQSTFDVARHFQELILSYQVGASKPEARIYQEVLDRSGLPAENILFVDDLEPNVRAARSLGIQSIQFTGIENLKRELKVLGIEI